MQQRSSSTGITCTTPLYEIHISTEHCQNETSMVTHHDHCTIFSSYINNKKNQQKKTKKQAV